MATRFLLPLWLSSPALACLYCFSNGAERLQVCQYFLGHESEQHGACLQALKVAFEPYLSTKVDANEMPKLKDTFSRIIFFMEEKGTAKVPYRIGISEAAEEVKSEVANLKKAPACIPPCGKSRNHLIFLKISSLHSIFVSPPEHLFPFWLMNLFSALLLLYSTGFQINARYYTCSTCSFEDCQLPIDCPIQDIDKKEGAATLLSCEVKFEIPRDRTIRWKFAKDLRTEDLFLFQDLSFGFNPTLLIRPTLGAHHGTFICEIAEGDDILLRKYFYVNVTEKRLGLEKELQSMFIAILNPPPKAEQEIVERHRPSLEDMLSGPNFLRKKNVILLIIGIVLGSMVFTMVAIYNQ
ncbi:sperm acrosome membrane-associated protein 6 isoform X2 [Anolis carolinensis]|uniref:sperm acrosome membrane-associated protein 6 isoform X2 n=1 Tax=Anolis carolinensis TaxID=28377 RepID=UPI002F2B69B4